MPNQNGDLQGFDTAAGAAAIVASLARSRVAKQDFIVGYYGHGRKVMSPGAASVISAAGLPLVMVYEDAPTSVEYFTRERGKADALEAVRQAKALGQPVESAIYFVVDYDAIDKDIRGPVYAYGYAFSDTLASSSYLCGCYGNGAVCAAMREADIVHYTFVWGAHKTNGTQEFIERNTWDLMQSPTVPAAVNRLGFDDDPDIGKAAGFGQFLVHAATPQTAVEAATVIPPARALQAALKAEGEYTGAVDGLWGSRSADALSRHYTAN